MKGNTFKVVVGVLIFLVAIIAYMVVVNNNAIRMQENIIALNKKSENSLSNLSMKIIETAQVPKKYKDDLKEVIRENFQGRYGKDGSQATFQWFKENNLNLDATLYQNIQNIIASGRDEFRISQDRIQGECRVYKAMLRTFPKKQILDFMGLEPMDEAYCTVISDENTSQIFESRKQTQINVFGD